MNAAFLLKSLAARPCTEPIDAVKWLYQSEFGCGHLLPPEDDCAARIAQEMAQTAQTVAEPPFEPLGDGLCRLNLAHPLTRALPPERIARMMRVTDGRVRGTQAGFDAKLAILEALAARAGADVPATADAPAMPAASVAPTAMNAPVMADAPAAPAAPVTADAPADAPAAPAASIAPVTADAPAASVASSVPYIGVPAGGASFAFQNTPFASIPCMGAAGSAQPEGLAPPGGLRLPFTAEALRATAFAFRAAPPSPPSHSERYRSVYAPAYRVVLRRFGEALPLLAQVEARLAEHSRATLVLDGDCASGKTTLAALLESVYGAAVIHMDDFFLPPALRTPARMAEAGGNIDYERFSAQVLDGLLGGGAFSFAAFNCHTGTQTPVTVPPAPVTIIEGSYALHPRFWAAYDALHAVRALVRVDGAEQRRRILARNGEIMLARFVNEWIPLEKRYLEAYHMKQASALTLLSERHAEDEPCGEAKEP